MRLPQRSSKAFTLIELIVVIVILGILALIAIPTFGKVISKSQDESTLTTLRSIARDAQALRALDQGSTWGSAPVDAIQETNQASGTGVQAAGTLKAVLDAGVDPKMGEVTYQAGDTGLVVSMLSGSKRICIVGASPTSATTGRCVEASTTGGKSTMGNALSSDMSLLPSGASLTTGGNSTTTTVPATTGYELAVAADSPASWWRLDETSGTTVVDSVNTSRTAVANNVTLAGSALGGNVTANDRAAYFNGSSYISLPGIFGGTANASVEVWYKTDAATGQFQAPVSSTASSFIQMQSSNTGNSVAYYNANGYAALPVIPESPTWHHAVITSAPGKQMLYVDGAAVGTGTTVNYQTLLETVNGGLNIGRGHGGGRYFKGAIAQVAIYDKALTAAQVQAHYNAR